MHGSEVGIWNHDFNYFGASYRFNYKRFDLQAGYFYRLIAEGNQGSPMLSLGFWF